MKKLFLMILMTTAIWSADNVSFSFKAPGNMPIDSIPIFVCFGFDDNCYYDGVKWADDLFMGKKNPDGNPARATFFISSHPDIQDQKLWTAIGDLYKHGHEIGDHTQHHNNDDISANINNATYWNNEIGGCIADLTKQSGIPKEAIRGFRAPFLLYSLTTFNAIKSNSIMYECSIEHGLGQYPDSGGVYSCGEVWPFTLDKGSIAPGALKTFTDKIPGLWELPVHEFLPATGWQGVTGLDWNVWFSKLMSKSAAVDLWKSSINIRVKGDSVRSIKPNRAPLFMGSHSDEYTDDNPGNTSPIKPTANTSDRRAAVSEFLTYVLSYNPAVRVVPMIEVIKWMKNPVPYTKYHFIPENTGVVTVAPDLKSFVSFMVSTISRTRLTISSPCAGNVNFSVYTIKGTKIAALGVKTIFKGINVLMFQREMAPGSYILKTSGTINTTTRFIIQ